jgi:hypothetical protein
MDRLTRAPSRRSRALALDPRIVAAQSIRLSSRAGYLRTPSIVRRLMSVFHFSGDTAAPGMKNAKQGGATGASSATAALLVNILCVEEIDGLGHLIGWMDFGFHNGGEHCQPNSAWRRVLEIRGFRVHETKRSGGKSLDFES